MSTQIISRSAMTTCFKQSLHSPTLHRRRHWWCNGQHCCLPSSRSGFDSRPMQLIFFIFFLFAHQAHLSTSVLVRAFAFGVGGYSKESGVITRGIPVCSNPFRNSVSGCIGNLIPPPIHTYMDFIHQSPLPPLVY